jgi:hypothetical protein
LLQGGSPPLVHLKHALDHLDGCERRSFVDLRSSGRLSKHPNEDEIRSVYDKPAISKSDQRAMLHPTNDLNLQSEILSSFRPGVLVHKSSFPSYTLSHSQAACQTLR